MKELNLNETKSISGGNTNTMKGVMSNESVGTSMPYYWCTCASIGDLCSQRVIVLGAMTSCTECSLECMSKVHSTVCSCTPIKE